METNPLIYALDDDVVFHQLFKRLLKGYRVEVFERALDFDYALKNHLPDLIILDIRLRDDNGLLILSSIKANPVTSKIPVVMVSFFSEIALVKRCIELGASQFLDKDNLDMELLPTVNLVFQDENCR